MRLINKQKEKKSEDINKNEEEKEILEEDIDYEDQQNLIAYAEQLQKLKEIRDSDKSVDLLQVEKNIKEKYKDIIIKYLYKQKQKELIKKRKLKDYEKSKIKFHYDEKKN